MGKYSLWKFCPCGIPGEKRHLAYNHFDKWIDRTSNDGNASGIARTPQRYTVRVNIGTSGNIVDDIMCILCLFVVTCMVPWCAVAGSPVPMIEHEG